MRAGKKSKERKRVCVKERGERKKWRVRYVKREKDRENERKKAETNKYREK